MMATSDLVKNKDETCEIVKFLRFEDCSKNPSNPLNAHIHQEQLAVVGRGEVSHVP